MACSTSTEHAWLHVQEPAVSDYRRGRPDPGGGLRGGAEADHQTAAEYVSVDVSINPIVRNLCTLI